MLTKCCLLCETGSDKHSIQITPQETLHLTLHTLHTLHTSHSTHCTPHTPHTAHLTLHTQHTSHSTHSTPHTPHTAHLTLHTQHTSHSTHSTPHTPHTAHLTLHTLHTSQVDSHDLPKPILGMHLCKPKQDMKSDNTEWSVNTEHCSVVSTCSYVMNTASVK